MRCQTWLLCLFRHEMQDKMQGRISLFQGVSRPKGCNINEKPPEKCISGGFDSKTSTRPESALNTESFLSQQLAGAQVELARGKHRNGFHRH